MKREDWISMAKSLGLALAGALVVWGADILLPMLENLDTPMAALLTAVVTVLINLGRKYLGAVKTQKAK